MNFKLKFYGILRSLPVDGEDDVLESFEENCEGNYVLQMAQDLRTKYFEKRWQIIFMAAQDRYSMRIHYPL
jgi:hypothetical protein